MAKVGNGDQDLSLPPQAFGYIIITFFLIIIQRKLYKKDRRNFIVLN
jgi:hypothetical protein